MDFLIDFFNNNSDLIIDILIGVGIFLGAFFVITFTIYYFNLDQKLLIKLYKKMTKRFDSMDRDRKL